MIVKDDVLKEIIVNSGYYEYLKGDVNLDDLPLLEKNQIILSESLLNVRPDLKTNFSADVIFLIKEGDNVKLPFKSLTALFNTSPKPYDDSEIWSFSLSEHKLLNKLYYGDGIKWRIYK